MRSIPEWIPTWEPDRHRFILGHSFGTLVVLYYVLREPGGLAGAIISSAAIDPFGIASPMLVRIARHFSRVWPCSGLSSPLEAAALSRNSDVVEADENDPLVHDQASARFGTGSLDRIERIKAHASDLGPPLLMILGGADRLNTIEGTRRFFVAVTYTDRELKIYRDIFHEPITI